MNTQQTAEKSNDVIAALGEKTLVTLAFMVSDWLENVDPDIKMVNGVEHQHFYLQPGEIAEIDKEIPDTYENFYIWADGRGLIGDGDDFDPEDLGKELQLNSDNIGDSLTLEGDADDVVDELEGDAFEAGVDEEQDLPTVDEIDAPLITPKSFMSDVEETFMEARLALRKLAVLGDGAAFTFS